MHVLRCQLNAGVVYLGLSLDFDDLGFRLGIPNADVLGALWVDRREVFIDQSLDPYEHPDMEGRYNFSVGHETGHWCLHRPYIANAAAQSAMFNDSETEPTVICRTSQAKERIEWQADYFSSCFLMPRQNVLEAWSDRFGSLKPIIYADIAEQNWTRRPTRADMKPIGMVLRNVIEQNFEPHAYAFETIAKEFKSMFRVSTIGLALLTPP